MILYKRMMPYFSSDEDGKKWVHGTRIRKTTEGWFMWGETEPGRFAWIPVEIIEVDGEWCKPSLFQPPTPEEMGQPSPPGGPINEVDA